MVRKSCLCVLLFLACVRQALAWSDPGHQIIWTAAQARLGPTAAQHVQDLLAPLSDAYLTRFANWADDVRSLQQYHTGPLKGDPEAEAFVARDLNQNCGQWHFVDLPLLSTVYPNSGPFISDNDVVHMINACVAVLRNPAGTDRFTELDALRLLVHFVGDLHQPLHVVSGYIKINSHGNPYIEKDPAKIDITQDASDRGGNQLRYTSSKKLHAFWDRDVVDEAMKQAGLDSLDDYATYLVQLGDDHPEWRPQGDPGTWAKAWVTDSLAGARKAYKGITKIRFLDANADPPTYKITLKSTYLADSWPIAEEQLAKASVRLAALLDDIWPSPP